MADLRLGAAVLTVALITLACGGSAQDEPAPTPASRQERQTPDVTTLGDPSLTVVNAILACNEKNAQLLQSFVARETSLTDITQLFSRGSDVQLRSQTIPEPEGDDTSITVDLRIRREGEIEEVERTWDLVRGDDGLWRFTDLPDCF